MQLLQLLCHFHQKNGLDDLFTLTDGKAFRVGEQEHVRCRIAALLPNYDGQERSSPPINNEGCEYSYVRLSHCPVLSVKAYCSVLLSVV